MQRCTLTFTGLLAYGLTSCAMAQSGETLRPPAVPLVAHNPFLSIWSESDKLTDKNTQHWTHHEHALSSMIRVDGKAYRLMGADPTRVAAMPQTSLSTTPTRSIYTFEGAGIRVTLTFLSPSIPSDLDLFSRPTTYITWKVVSVDGKSHEVSLFDAASGWISVSEPSEPIGTSHETTKNLSLWKFGRDSQMVLNSGGDDHRLNWGYGYLAARKDVATGEASARSQAFQHFISGNGQRVSSSVGADRPAGQPTVSYTFNLGTVTAKPVERQVIFAYDELYSIKYYRKPLLPYWKRNGMTMPQLLEKASAEYPSILKKCEKFDRELTADLTRAGGAKYAAITALSYRECVAACGLAADGNKQPLFFTKENTSNGDIGTVDVFYPMDPIWVLLSPTLAKATLVPILEYASSPRWKFPNAPHDLGVYPIVRGTDDGGEGMPVEESGNMLLLCDAVAKAEGNAKFVEKWWPKLTQWASYLERYGLDPEEQLCTDDFMGHLAHNANLSIKAILGLAAYGDLARMRGDVATAERYKQIAKTDAAHWVKVASDGNHFRLAFDKPNTWSQKYNLVWDRVLDLDIFPADVAKTEVAFYKTQLRQFGVPLDSRTKLTKADWSIWSATMAENRADFEAIVNPMFDYYNVTTRREALADSFVTDDLHSGGMHARPVVGGFFMKLLADKEVWQKWASRDKSKVSNWAPLPKAPTLTTVVPVSKDQPIEWSYTFDNPGDGWQTSGFDSSKWKKGVASFGTVGDPRTAWTSGDIWIRRTVTLPSTGDWKNLQLYVFHDEDVEIYINGVLAGTESSFNSSYDLLSIRPEALAVIKPGETVTLAAHCHQTVGGQNIDFGIVEVTEKK